MRQGNRFRVDFGEYFDSNPPHRRRMSGTCRTTGRPSTCPASNLEKRGQPCLVNTSDIDTEAVITTGLDDQGETPPEGEGRLTLPVDEACILSAQAQEPGGDELEGRGQWMMVAGGAGADTFNVVSGIDPEKEEWK